MINLQLGTYQAVRSRPKIENRLALADPALGRVIDAVVARLGPQRIAPSRAAPFEALVRAVVYQNVSGKAAASIFARFKETLGPAHAWKVAALSPKSFVKFGLSNAKARTIQNLAAWFASNRKLASALPTLPDEEIIGALFRYSRHWPMDHQRVPDLQSGPARCHACR